MNCLTDWIGIYGTPDSYSGVSINQLPGVDLDSLESVSKPEQETYLGVWADIQARGVRKFTNRLQTELTKKYRLKQLKATMDLGSIIDKVAVSSGTGNYRGFIYELKLENQFRKSNFQALYVQKLKLYLMSSANTTVKIVDLDTGEVLFTYSLTGSAGWNTIQVNQRLFGQRFMFAYDDTGLTCPSLQINDVNSDWFNTMHQSVCNCTASIQGAITTDVSQIGTEAVDVSTNNNTYGLSGVFSLVCTFDYLICNNKELMTTALWYCLGIETMLEILYSNRLNKFTTVDKQKASENLEYFEKEFENEIAILADGIQLSTDDTCIDCNTQIETLECIV